MCGLAQEAHVRRANRHGRLAPHRAQRPNGSAAEQRNELAPSHGLAQGSVKASKTFFSNARQGVPRISKSGRRPTMRSSLRNHSRPRKRHSRQRKCPSRRNRRNRSLCSHSRDIQRRRNHDIRRNRHNHDIHRSRSRAPPA